MQHPLRLGCAVVPWFDSPDLRIGAEGAGFAPMAHVLVVDDDVEILDAMSALLEGEGHHVLVAKHGAEALKRLSTGALPDLVLLDLLMPVMDGWTFLQRVRECPRLRGLRVSVMSASGRAADAAAEAGVRYFPKPISLHALLEHVARIVPTVRHPSYRPHLDREPAHAAVHPA